jgi:hypothetical protein
MANAKPVVSPLCAKAIGLMRSHYVYSVRLVRTGYMGSWRIPEFTWDYGLYNSHTGARVMGFGVQTLRELRKKKLVSDPAKFPNCKRGSSDSVYTLSPRAAEVVVLAAVLQAVHEV